MINKLNYLVFSKHEHHMEPSSGIHFVNLSLGFHYLKSIEQLALHHIHINR
jgi:hypothetical protein